MRFGYVGSPDAVDEIGRIAAAAEREGFDFYAVGDSHTMWPDPYVLLAQAVMATERIRLGVLVTNPVTRHVAATANAVATLDAMSGGRLFLGIGTGDNAVLNVGKSPATVEEFGAAVVAIRDLMAGEPIAVDGHRIVRRWSQQKVPVLMAAEGPRTLRLAGQIADGVVVGVGLTQGSLLRAHQLLIEGATSVGRDLEEIEVWHIARWAIAEDRSTAIESIASILAAAGHHALGRAPAAKGVAEELVRPVQELDRRYDSRYHAVRGSSPNADLVVELGLLEYFADRFAIAGSPQDCVAKVRQLEGWGVKRLVLTKANTGDMVEEITRWSDEVGSHLME